MLHTLLIRNIALFEEAKLSFGPGFHVLTGETGAGKSLVVDAVNLLCGARADRDLIRTGSEKAYVEGTFSVHGQTKVKQWLLAQELNADETEEDLILSREINRAGRSTCRINGTAVSLNQFRELTRELIDLHGQHEHQSLLDESNHLGYLDLLGDEQHQSLLTQTGQAHITFKDAERRLIKARKLFAERVERQEILSIRSKELKDAKLIKGEEEELGRIRDRLRNADRILKILQEANTAISSSATSSDSALLLLNHALKQLEGIVSFDQVYLQLRDRLYSLYYELEELGFDLAKLQDQLEVDDYHLEAVETRLDFLRRLGRKYGRDSEAMLEVLQKTEEELATIETLDEDLANLEKETDRSFAQFISVSRLLSASRQTLALSVEQQIVHLLHQLNMANTRVNLAISQDESQGSVDGIDHLSILMAANIGEEMKPLSKIASGGEMSRIMLAMKSLTANKNAIPTMVFDEIDTGVSGATAGVIAKRMWDIARFRQVICVSHLHQVAVMANTHFRVSKAEDQGRTFTKVTRLNDEDRITEISSMLGDDSSKAASAGQHAKALLADAKDYQHQHPLMNGA